jgi:hypothetical protein
MRVSLDLDADALPTAMEFAHGRSRGEVVNEAPRPSFGPGGDANG